MDNKSRQSDSCSHSSASSSLLARTKAKAEAAKARLLFAEREAVVKLELQRNQNNLDLLGHQKEVAAAEAELSVVQQVEGELCLDLPLSSPDKQEMTRKYVSEHSKFSHEDMETDSKTEHVFIDKASTPVVVNTDNITLRKKPVNKPVNKGETSQHAHFNVHAPEYVPINQQPYNVATELTRFLLKKDLMLHRLTPFSDEPSSYQVWKNSFKNVTEELQANAAEELDLLVKWLGPESRRYAVSLRAANSADPRKGLERLWSRLEERFGSCEMVDMCIKTKLSTFGRITHKDYKKLFDLSDILTEIESLKEDERYSSSLAYFDASTGVNPIVQKLPLHLQSKWIDRASTYKKQHCVAFPPFTFFADFVRKMSSTLNDPSFHYDVQNGVSTSAVKDTGFKYRSSVSTKKTEVEEEVAIRSKNVPFCPLHRLYHSLNKCRKFKDLSIAEKKNILSKHQRCFRCLDSDQHTARTCDSTVKCTVCESTRHSDVMHDENFKGAGSHGGERHSDVSSKCSQVCGDNFSGKSCAKTILAKIYPKGHSEKCVLTYAIVDDQSNRTLAKSELFDLMPNNVTDHGLTYSLSSCSGMIETSGRQLEDLVIESMDRQTSLDLPAVIECEYIPDIRDEIPTPSVVQHQPHLQHLTDSIPSIHPEAKILLLIGRDLPEAHHVHEQCTGPKGSPFAQHLPLGWVVVGDVCLGQVHKPHVGVKKTVVLPDGRPSIFNACTNNFSVKTISPVRDVDRNGFDDLGSTVFEKTKDDDKRGLSVQDKLFLQLMDKDFKKDGKGNWTAPLPFKQNRQKLPNNREQALKRAQLLDTNLKKNPQKKEHFFEFMKDIFDYGHAEPAPQMSQGEECWYLPIFGVYHPKKPNQLRAVFDSSSTFQGISLNKVLMTGPDLTNSLLGVLLRFRKAPIAVTADIQKMFYCFFVTDEDRNYLRFFWYKDNKLDNPLIEYRMCVHVFGNSPSPAVATYGLRRTVENCEDKYGKDVKDFIQRDFYVDDALASVETDEEGVSLIKRTQEVLQDEGRLRLHKIASNSKQVMGAFPQEDLAKELKTLDIMSDDLPVQHSLGLSWDLNSDSFLFKIHKSKMEKPFTRRGLLSAINSIFDPLGFLAPITVQGKILLRELSSKQFDWDQDLPPERQGEWNSWKQSLRTVEELEIPRSFMAFSLTKAAVRELHIYSDASEKAIASVAYMKVVDERGNLNFGFILGKAKVAPTHGNTVPRLELCAAVLSVEISEFIGDQLNIEFDAIRFYTDSKVVLGYIRNETKRFYTYVTNRVDKIRRLSSPDQWCYVHTDSNPADTATRSCTNVHMKSNVWLTGPSSFVKDSNFVETDFPLIDPDSDKEIRPVVVAKTDVSNKPNSFGVQRFANFSGWRSLVKAVCLLKKRAKAQHNTQVSSADQETVKAYHESEKFILKQVQRETYQSEVFCLESEKPISKQSSILKLNQFLDFEGLLRVGGRIKNSGLTLGEVHPLIIPGKSHVGRLLVTHFHEMTKHQGRHLTEGAIRSSGYWITGVKRIVSSILHYCVTCRKLRRPVEGQKMADLPSDRITPGPPFSSVGVDTFGPWSVVTRKTRGGQANSKRWAVLFTCLTTRAVHIEVVEEMSSSSFINALRRLIALRGKVRLFRSDRGTNFTGAATDLKINSVNVEDGPVKSFLDDSECTWIFNSPHSSHMGGAWERLIGMSRRILDSILNDFSTKNLTHEVLVTFMAEVCAILNARPITPVSSDPESPSVMSPSMLLTQKSDHIVDSSLLDFDLPDMYKAQWKRVQYLANSFWNRWQKEYLYLLQNRQKWQNAKSNLKCGDVVLLKEKDLHRNDWPMGRIINTLPSDDDIVRKVQIQVFKNDKLVTYTRPVTETVLLIGE